MWRFVTAWQSIFVKWQGAQWKVSLSVSGDKYRHNNCISLHFTNRDINRHEVDQFSHLTSVASSDIYLHLLADVRGTPGWYICRSCWTRWSLWSLSPARSSLQSPAHQTPCLLCCHSVVTLWSRHWSLRWPASNWAPCSSLAPAARPGTNRSGSQLYSHGGPWWSEAASCLTVHVHVLPTTSTRGNKSKLHICEDRNVSAAEDSPCYSEADLAAGWGGGTESWERCRVTLEPVIAW